MSDSLSVYLFAVLKGKSGV